MFLFPCQIACPACGHASPWSREIALERVRAQGHFRREANPEDDLLWEFAQRLASQQTCESCGRLGLELAAHQDDGDDWETGRACQVCRQPIPAERLEVFPDTQRCTACQALGDSGATDEDAEYCPRCGGIMETALRGGGGVSQYRLVCRDCGR